MSVEYVCLGMMRYSPTNLGGTGSCCPHDGE